MSFPLNFWDISLLLAATSLVLIVTSGILSEPNDRIHFDVNKKRLNQAALAVSALFFLTVIIRIIIIFAQ